MKYKNIINIKKLTSVYNAHKNKNKNNEKRVISIALLCLSDVLNMAVKLTIQVTVPL